MVIPITAIATVNRQNYLCHSCKRQFVEGGQDWFVSEYDKILINKLLLERICLCGIGRVCNVSQQWLLDYLKKLYENLPDDLNTDLTLPDIDTYLADRRDEEIGRIEAIKKFDCIIEIHPSIRK